MTGEETSKLAVPRAPLSYDELTQFLQRAAERYPDLLALRSLATTPEGRTIWCAEVTAPTGTAAIRKPGFLLQGNLHADELAGSTACLYILRALLLGYAQDPAVRERLEKQVIYILPRIAVDGAEHTLRTGYKVRSRKPQRKERNVPFPEDLNQDGKILMMRWKSDKGRFVADEEDPRLMFPKGPGDQHRVAYGMAIEGMIHRWDGGTVRRSRQHCDFNRDFPAGWRPRPEWIGMGRYPLSQVETRAVADFVLDHPNLYGCLDFHTGNPAIFYPAAAGPGREKSLADARMIHTIGRRGEQLTRFPLLSGYSEAINGTHAEPLGGAFKDWAYEHVGIIPFIVELGLFYNSLDLYPFTAPLGQTRQSYPSFKAQEKAIGLALLQWQDRNPSQALFFDWSPFDHPQLGEVEIGGWNYAHWSNPAVTDMPRTGARCYDFFMHFTAMAPRLEIKPERVEAVEPGLVNVTLRIVNSGGLPTFITEQGRSLNPYDQPVVTLAREDGKPLECHDGKPVQPIGHLDAGAASRSMAWVVAMDARTRLKVTVASQRGIFVEKTIPVQ